MKYKDIKGYESYSISEDGLVWSKNRSREKSSVEINGYKYVKLHKNGKSKMFRVHRLVAETYICNPNNKPQVNHKDGDKANNHVDNLEWCTASENAIHAIDLGLSTTVGENHPRSVLDDREVSMIRYMRRSLSMTCVDISKCFNVSHTWVAKVCSNKLRKHSSYELSDPDKSKCKEFKECMDLNKNNNRGRSVIQLDLEGRFIKKWNRIRDIKEELAYSSASISACCLGKKKTYMNFKWEYYGK